MNILLCNIVLFKQGILVLLCCPIVILLIYLLVGITVIRLSFSKLDCPSAIESIIQDSLCKNYMIMDVEVDTFFFRQ